MQPRLDISGLKFKTVSTVSVTAEDHRLMQSLFDACYLEADHRYFEKSLAHLLYVTFAWDEAGSPAGFGIADSVVHDLPRLPLTTLTLGGLCCVLPEFHDRGLVGALEARSIGAAGVVSEGRWMTCGQMANPEAFRLMAANPTAVPRPGVTPTPWQQEVGQAVAGVYRVENFDPETFVCAGAGKPIGYPVTELEANEDELEVFKPVDRDRGDVLLGIAWTPTAPADW